MAFFNSGGTVTQELYLPVRPEIAFQSLVWVAKNDWSFKSADDFTMAVTFDAGVSALTWGETVSAQTVPTGDAATIRLTVAPKLGGSVGQSGKSQRIIDQTFARVTEVVKDYVKRQAAADSASES